MEAFREMISDVEHPKKKVQVMGKSMAYVEMGDGDPIVFLHGNPTSSYLWRNIMPHLSDQGRCIAPDLIGMGDSDKLDNPGPGSYRFIEHRDFFDGFFDSLDLKDNVTLVLHDWGSALGFDWARRNPDRVRGIAYMEAFVLPLKWSQFPEQVRPLFEAFRSPAGEDMILQNNFFVEHILPGAIVRKLTDKEMSVYRHPYESAGEDRRPTLTWPREIPLDGEPTDVASIVSEYSNWMAVNDLPKLFIEAKPGALIRGELADYVRTWKNQTEVTVKGVHFIQEDCPDEIGRAISAWLGGLS